MKCRKGCGMCCVEPSIAQPLPGMPEGKKARQACVNLDPQSLLCRIWNKPEYPLLCKRFQAAREICGDNRQEAQQRLRLLEEITSP